LTQLEKNSKEEKLAAEQKYATLKVDFTRNQQLLKE